MNRRRTKKNLKFSYEISTSISGWNFVTHETTSISTINRPRFDQMSTSKSSWKFSNFIILKSTSKSGGNPVDFFGKPWSTSKFAQNLVEMGGNILTTFRHRIQVEIWSILFINQKSRSFRPSIWLPGGTLFICTLEEVIFNLSTFSFTICRRWISPWAIEKIGIFRYNLAGQSPTWRDVSGRYSNHKKPWYPSEEGSY